jgi:hypothetical protein
MFCQLPPIIWQTLRDIRSTTDVRKQNVTFTASYTCDVLSSMKYIFFNYSEIFMSVMNNCMVIIITVIVLIVYL